MKVLHVIPSLWAGDGGPTQALLSMERALVAQGVGVETATTDHDGPGRRNGIDCGRPLAQGDSVRWYFPKRLDFYKVAPAFVPWMRSSVARFDVVHVHALFSFTSTIAARAARRAGVPYVIRPLGTLGDYGMRERRPLLKRLSFRANEAGLLQGAAAVHFTSEQEAAQARGLNLRLREAIIPLGIDVPEAGRPARNGAAFNILFLSRLDPKKNVEGLFDAIALLVQDMPALRLTIAGGGPEPYMQALRSRAERLRIGSHIRWLGHVEGSAREAAFSQTDIFALPSHSENFGIAAAEALVRGLPCLLGEGVAIAAEVAQAGAGRVTRTDPESIAANLRLMMQSSAGLQEMSRNAKRLATERYSLDAMGRNLADLYTSILAR